MVVASISVGIDEESIEGAIAATLVEVGMKWSVVADRTTVTLEEGITVVKDVISIEVVADVGAGGRDTTLVIPTSTIDVGLGTTPGVEVFVADVCMTDIVSIVIELVLTSMVLEGTGMSILSLSPDPDPVLST